MKKIVKDKKPKNKQKIKSKNVKKLKINKQNQNVKVNIKIGSTDDKKQDYRNNSSSNIISSYPLFQNQPPPVNIINNPIKESPIAPNINIAEPTPTTETTALNIPIQKSLTSIRLKPLRKIKKRVKDVIPISTNYSGYHSDISDSPIFNEINPMYASSKKEEPNIIFNENDLLVAKQKLKPSIYGEMVKNPVTGRLIRKNGKTYMKLVQENIF